MSSINFSNNTLSLHLASAISRNSSELSESFQRLSTGLRINVASDDPAGAALAEQFKSRGRLYSVAARNISDGTSLLTIADSAVSGLQNITGRLKELAEQAQSTVLSSTQRGVLQSEFDALVDQYNGIVSDTEFNTRKIFDGSYSHTTIQAGPDSGDQITLAVGTQLDFTSSSSETAGTGTFDAVTSIATAGVSYDLQTADFNEDGLEDIIVGRNNILTEVHLSNGNGTFSAQIVQTNGSNGGITTGDFNNDGNVDIVTQGTINLGNGNGSFKAATGFAVGYSSNQISAADVNGDQNQDLVIFDPFTKTAYVQIGNGNGTFKAATTVAKGFSNPIGNLAIGDLNGDGRVDLAIGDNSVSKAFVFLSNGNGSFAAAVTFTLAGGAAIGQTKIVDVDGDSKEDLVVTTTFGPNTGIAVLLGNGNGSFKAGASYYAAGVSEGDASDVVLTDFNSDGNLDAVTTHGYLGVISVLVGNGDGSFKAKTSYAAATGSSVHSADFTGDGFEDVVFLATSGAIYLATDGSETTTVSTTSRTISGLQLDSVEHATDAFDSLSNLDDSLTRERGVIGGQLSRLSVAYENALSSKINFEAAATRITDIDAAEEIAQNVRLRVIQSTLEELFRSASSLGPDIATLIKESTG